MPERLGDLTIFIGFLREKSVACHPGKSVKIFPKETIEFPPKIHSKALLTVLFINTIALKKKKLNIRHSFVRYKGLLKISPSFIRELS